ncbi:MAG: serine/threonine-protein phosphatase [Clostridia bacterium]|nr:serine/threonine-protein phosphatase [Clostridia bacterium]
MKCKTVLCTSVGKKRQINQDNYYVNGHINKNYKKNILKSCFKSQREQILCICDGMGGEKYGETASYLAVKKLISYKKRYSSLINRFGEHMEAYMNSANNAICSFISENGGERSGSTIALLCISSEKQEAVAANIGDTKVFLYRNKELKKLSEDHNQAQSLVNLGIITEEIARTHKEKSKLTQHLGIFSEEMVLEPYITDSIILEKNDKFLVCSDGLTDMLNYAEISEIMENKMSLKKKCKKLVDKANNNGGEDNITVILAEIV